MRWDVAISPCGDYWWRDEGPLPSWFSEDCIFYVVPECEDPWDFLDEMLLKPEHRLVGECC